MDDIAPVAVNPTVTTSTNTVENNAQGKAAPSLDVYQVERILEKTLLKGQTYYLIKWVGYNDPKDNSWTHIDDCQCPEAILAFEKKRNSYGKKPAKGPKKIGPKAKHARNFKSDLQYVMENAVTDESSSTTDPHDYLVEPSPGRSYGFQSGKRVEVILGAKKHQTMGMVILYKYEDGTYELAPTSLFSDYHPKLLIKFYEDRSRFF